MFIFPHVLHVSASALDHGVHNIIILNIVSHNFQYPFGFQYITLIC